MTYNIINIDTQKKRKQLTKLIGLSIREKKKEDASNKKSLKIK
jgi:hypothetical protein